MRRKRHILKDSPGKATHSGENFMINHLKKKCLDPKKGGGGGVTKKDEQNFLRNVLEKVGVLGEVS